MVRVVLVEHEKKDFNLESQNMVGKTFLVAITFNLRIWVS